MSNGLESPDFISITPLLKRLWPAPDVTNVTAAEIALAISHIFSNSLSPVQTGALLTCLHFTGWDRRADVLAKCSDAMRQAAAVVDLRSLREVIRIRGTSEGGYRGGLCDIVGTGGDDHSTFNVSTSSSIVASSFLLMAKHGNRASTSKSGSADILNAMSHPPNLNTITADHLPKIYQRSNYAFLFAPLYHPGMKYVATIRRELGWRTIFNLLGPLSNPVDDLIEARVIGVARRDMGPVFAEALKLNGTRKALIVCGDEDLDEISCAGPTHCWQLKYDKIERFTLTPSDFGLKAHKLSEIQPGRSPQQNAVILEGILQNRSGYEAIVDFILMNTAALLVVSGLCESNESNFDGGHAERVVTERGPGGGRWKEGVRRARWAIESGRAWKSWKEFVESSNSLNQA